MAHRSPRFAEAILALVLVAVVPRDTEAQSGWQPASGHTQIALWPDNPPNTRPGAGPEAVHYATDAGTGIKKYRVPCKHQGAYRECPQAHQDAQRAMRMVRSRAGEWKIDPRKIGVIGFSAGAHMSIMSSTRFDRLYAAVDVADSASSRPDFALVLYPGRMAYRHTNFAPNPAIRVTQRTPPTFLVHSYDDEMNPVENSLLYAAALRKAGVPAELHVYAKGGHAFGLRRTGLSASGWPQLAEAWLKAIGVIRG